MFSDPAYAGSIFNEKILISTNSRVFKRARRGDHDALVVLASVIKHEEAHLHLGNCELEPYQIQLRIFDDLEGFIDYLKENNGN